MKKRIVLLLVMAVLLCKTSGIANSDRPTPLPAAGRKVKERKGFDLSEMTDEELKSLIDEATKELNDRSKNDGGYKTSDEGWIVFDEGDIKITIAGDFAIKEWFGTPYLGVQTVIENGSQNEIQVCIDNASINGWQISDDGIWDEPVKSGLKNKATYGLNLNDAGVNNIQDIRDIKFSFIVKNYPGGETLYETGITSWTSGQ